MRKKILLSLLFLLSLGAVYYFFIYDDGTYNPPDAEPFQALPLGKAVLKTDADNLTSTTVTYCLDTSVTLGKNLIWCGTVKLAWDELCKLNNGQTQFDEKKVSVEKITNEKFSSENIGKDKYVADAGFIEDGIIQKIENQVKENFALNETPELLKDIKDNEKAGVLAYSYLSASLPFEYAFDRATYPIKFKDIEVENFGIKQSLDYKKEAALARQIFVYYDEAKYNYSQPEEIVAEIKTRSESDQLILAKINPEATLELTINKALSFMNKFSRTRYEQAGSAGSVCIPVMDFDLQRFYPELSGTLKSSNPKINGQRVLCEQNIRFRLDEKGAVIKSESCIAGCKGVSLIFDKSFLIMLKQKDSDIPYFAAWVDNPEILVPFDKTINRNY